MSLRCGLDMHDYRWQFVGSSWQPDDYIRTCSRCGIEAPE